MKKVNQKMNNWTCNNLTFKSRPFKLTAKRERTSEEEKNKRSTKKPGLEKKSQKFRKWPTAILTQFLSRRIIMMELVLVTV